MGFYLYEIGHFESVGRLLPLGDPVAFLSIK
jgi:hypothetical protein